MRRVGEVTAALGLLICMLPFRSLLAVGPIDCTVCIIEVQTQGINSATEDYVVLANNSNDVFQASAANPITLKYFTAGGANTKSRDIIITTSLAANSAMAFVSDSLHLANPAITVFPSGLAFSDTGGTVQLLQNAQILDQVGWGTASLRESVAASTHKAGASLTRHQSGAGWQDSGDNSADFAASPHACYGLALNEIQPFGVDTTGDDIDPFIELLSNSPDSANQDCPMQINGDRWNIAAGDINIGLFVVTQLLDGSANTQPISLKDDTSNNLQFMPVSLFGGISLPGANLSQPVLSPGQSYAKISNIWRTTYLPTMGLANQYTATPSPTATNSHSQTDSCDQVIMNELLPNPVGEDTGHEWLELRSLSDEAIFLSNCALSVNGTVYNFAPDQWIDSNQLPVFANFSDGQTIRALSLKNTGISTVSFGHLTSDGNFGALQTIQYQDAPEGQSWARFDDGWHWLSVPTPGDDNAIIADTQSNNLEPTEFPAHIVASDETNDAQTNTAQPQVIISELLPNPAAPQTDENDEFVELYNNGIDALDLDGYKVQTGSNYSYSYTITDQIIPAGGYLVLTSGNTGFVLANSTGQARLLDPYGVILSQTDSYEDAPEGAAWALSDNTWLWTTTSTPGAANNITAVLSGTSSKKTTTKKSATTKKAKTAKPKKTKAAKKTKSKATGSTGFSNNETPPVQPLHMAVLVAVGALALLYGAYEYRHDVANLLYKFRRNRETRRVARA